MTAGRPKTRFVSSHRQGPTSLQSLHRRSVRYVGRSKPSENLARPQTCDWRSILTWAFGNDHVAQFFFTNEQGRLQACLPGHLGAPVRRRGSSANSARDRNAPTPHLRTQLSRFATMPQNAPLWPTPRFDSVSHLPWHPSDLTLPAAVPAPQASSQSRIVNGHPGPVRTRQPGLEQRPSSRPKSQTNRSARGTG